MVIGVLRNKKRGIPLFIVITIKSGSNFSMGIIFEIIMNITKIFVVNPATNDGAGFTFKYGGNNILKTIEKPTNYRHECHVNKICENSHLLLQ